MPLGATERERTPLEMARPEPTLSLEVRVEGVVTLLRKWRVSVAFVDPTVSEVRVKPLNVGDEVVAMS